MVKLICPFLATHRGTLPLQHLARLLLSFTLAVAIALLAPASPVLATPALPTPLLAQSIDTLRQRQRQIEQQRRSLDNRQDQLEDLQKSAENRLGGIQNRIQATAAEIKQNEAKLAEANQRLQRLRIELAKAEQDYEKQQSATVARLRFLQRQKDSHGWAVLLQSQSLNEFLDRRFHLKRVYQADRTFLENLQAKAKDLEKRHRQVEKQKNEISLLTQELQAQKSEFEAQAATQKALIDRLERDRAALEEAEAQLERDSANLAALIRQRILAAAARNRIAVRGTGIFSFPAAGRISSGFGYRLHPILGYRRFHAGVDFAGPVGTPIRAADDGIVLFSGWYGGYGNTVIIDHGNDIVTLYAHASRLYVNEGQRVRRGEAIAAIGSTGLSTGPHLHFEVRRSGDPVDPLAFL